MDKNIFKALSFFFADKELKTAIQKAKKITNRMPKVLVKPTELKKPLGG